MQTVHQKERLADGIHARLSPSFRLQLIQIARENFLSPSTFVRKVLQEKIFDYRANRISA